MQVPFAAGDSSTIAIRARTLLAIVVNEAAVKVHWPGQNPSVLTGAWVGRTAIDFKSSASSETSGTTAWANPTVPEVHLSSAIVCINPLRFLVRSTLPPETLIPEVRRAIQGIDPAQPIHDVAMMRDIVRRLVVARARGFGDAAVLRAGGAADGIAGIYGVVSYSVRQATVEIGTRMALGATGRDLLLMVVGDGLKMAAYGAAIGAVGIAASRRGLLVRAFEIPGLGALPFIASTRRRRHR